MEKTFLNLRTTAGDMTTIMLAKIRQFIKNSGFDPDSFFYRKVDESGKVLVDFTEFEVSQFKNEGEDFNGDVGRSVDFSNYDLREDAFFMDKFFKVISSSWNYLIIKIEEGLYAKIERDSVYEWDDLK